MAEDKQGMTPVADAKEETVTEQTSDTKESSGADNYEGPLPKVIIGYKTEMTQIFDENGNVHAVTKVLAQPMIVTARKTVEKDGYQAVQFGIGEKRDRNNKDTNKQKTAGTTFAKLQEFKTDLELPLGSNVDVSVFEAGDKVHAQGTTKGKGFQGGVKRHGMKGGPRTHGQKHSEREIGSIGGGGREGGRVVKGKKMPGHMGVDTVTVKNLQVLKVDKDASVLYVKGALPGRRGSLVTIYNV